MEGDDVTKDSSRETFSFPRIVCFVSRSFESGRIGCENCIPVAEGDFVWHFDLQIFFSSSYLADVLIDPGESGGNEVGEKSSADGRIVPLI